MEMNIPAGGDYIINAACHRARVVVSFHRGASRERAGEHQHRLAPNGCRKVSVFYLTRPGDGKLTITVSQDRYADQVVSAIDCDAALGLVKQDFDVTDRARPSPSRRKRRTPHVGWSASCSGETADVDLRSNYGGSSLQSQEACLDAGSFNQLYLDLLSHMHIGLAIMMDRPEEYITGNYSDSLDAMLDAWAEVTDVSLLVVGEQPKGSDTAVHAISSRTGGNVPGGVLARGIPFIDAYAFPVIRFLDAFGLEHHGASEHKGCRSPWPALPTLARRGHSPGMRLFRVGVRPEQPRVMTTRKWRKTGSQPEP